MVHQHGAHHQQGGAGAEARLLEVYPTADFLTQAGIQMHGIRANSDWPNRLAAKIRDRDPEAIAVARELEDADPRFQVFYGPFVVRFTPGS